MICSVCGHQGPERAKFCSECGTPAAQRCASCNAELTPAAKFCLYLVARGRITRAEIFELDLDAAKTRFAELGAARYENGD
jgi:hypothetical protein